MRQAIAAPFPDIESAADLAPDSDDVSNFSLSAGTTTHQSTRWKSTI